MLYMIVSWQIKQQGNVLHVKYTFLLLFKTQI
jgi:hypothetical protein